MTIRILLVDDNTEFLAAVRQFLVKLPMVEVVGEAHDGRAALDQTLALQPDLVLLDIVMPELNGLNVARAMQAWPKPPYIVFLSLNDGTAYRAAAHSMGAAAFVSKANFVTGLLPIIDALAAAKESLPENPL